MIIIDVLINFNTAFYEKGIIHIKHNEIFSNYIKGHLIYDILVLFPILLSSFSVPYINIILVFRIIRAS